MNFLLFLFYAILGTAVLWVILTNVIRLDKRGPVAFIIITFLYGAALAYFISYYSSSSEYKWVYYVLGGFIALSPSFRT
jgi:RsiW-degrading membrane proteinase PrsW (M82 family)